MNGNKIGDNVDSRKKEIAYLCYHLGLIHVARLSGADNTDEVRRWMQRTLDSLPTTEQSARLQYAYQHLVHITSGQGKITDPKWLTSKSVIEHLRNNDFKKVEEQTGVYVLVKIDQ